MPLKSHPSKPPFLVFLLLSVSQTEEKGNRNKRGKKKQGGDTIFTTRNSGRGSRGVNYGTEPRQFGGGRRKRKEKKNIELRRRRGPLSRRKNGTHS